METTFSSLKSHSSSGSVNGVNIPPQAEHVVFEGRVESAEYYGLYIKYYIDLGFQTVKVIEKNDGVNLYEEGQTVRVVIDPKDLMFYPPGEEPEVTL